MNVICPLDDVALLDVGVLHEMRIAPYKSLASEFAQRGHAGAESRDHLVRKLHRTAQALTEVRARHEAIDMLRQRLLAPTHQTAST